MSVEKSKLQIGKCKTREQFYSQMQRINNEKTSAREVLPNKSMYDKYI